VEPAWHVQEEPSWQAVPGVAHHALLFLLDPPPHAV